MEYTHGEHAGGGWAVVEEGDKGTGKCTLQPGFARDGHLVQGAKFRYNMEVAAKTREK